jgi:DNA-directed RNA polymerase subunit RPC12/RpoP
MSKKTLFRCLACRKIFDTRKDPWTEIAAPINAKLCLKCGLKLESTATEMYKEDGKVPVYIDNVYDVGE